MSTPSALRFRSGEFFGGVRRLCSMGAVTVSHRIADRSPDEVLEHTHEDAHFVLVTGGKYVSTAAGTRLEERPVLIYNPPGTAHRDRFERGRGSFFAISLAPEAAALALAGSSVPRAAQHLIGETQHSLVSQIARACTRDDGLLSVEALCFELLGSMEPQIAPSLPPAWLRLAHELLCDRYADGLTIGDIAHAVGVHPIHLARVFRRHYRCTPGDFQRFRRLERAAALLTEARHAPGEIAQRCGFADQSQLTKAFTRLFGLPPGAYRRATR